MHSVIWLLLVRGIPYDTSTSDAVVGSQPLPTRLNRPLPGRPGRGASPSEVATELHRTMDKSNSAGLSSRREERPASKTSTRSSTLSSLRPAELRLSSHVQCNSVLALGRSGPSLLKPFRAGPARPLCLSGRSRVKEHPPAGTPPFASVNPVGTSPFREIDFELAIASLEYLVPRTMNRVDPCSRTHRSISPVNSQAPSAPTNSNDPGSNAHPADGVQASCGMHPS